MTSWQGRAHHCPFKRGIHRSRVGSVLGMLQILMYFNHVKTECKTFANMRYHKTLSPTLSISNSSSTSMSKASSNLAFWSTCSCWALSLVTLTVWSSPSCLVALTSTTSALWLSPSGSTEHKPTAVSVPVQKVRNKEIVAEQTTLRKLIYQISWYRYNEGNHWGPVFNLWLSKVSPNGIRRYMCNVYSQWLRPCSAINRKPGEEIYFDNIYNYGKWC